MSIINSEIAGCLSNLPPTGTYDWFPQEMLLRQYIFNTWRRICRSFGYQEYLTPILESADIYRAKSGEDVGDSELMVIKKDGGDLALRPEMTPSVTRMLTRIYQQTPKPIRYFSIANFYRYQRPQRGRNREFWQLNFDIFGSESIQAEVEVLQLALEIMAAFGAPDHSFTLYLNHRQLIDAILHDVVGVSVQQKVAVVRLMDKWDKLNLEVFQDNLRNIGLNLEQVANVVAFMRSDCHDSLISNFPKIVDNHGLCQINEIIRILHSRGYVKQVRFQPNVIRGFDYYDGLVFEIFDNHPKNRRALFGGGRYNSLASLFGKTGFPAIGCGAGDEAMKLFLEVWGMLDQIKQSYPVVYYAPLLDEDLRQDLVYLITRLRKDGKNIDQSLEQISLNKAFKYANTLNYPYMIIYGKDEHKAQVYKIKDLCSGEEEIIPFTK